MLYVLQGMAAINPVYKECMQRGYTVSGDSCIFPDGSACDLESFNEGACGTEWLTDEYCIPEGEYVWDDEKCCEGTDAYLPEDVAGQARCVSLDEIPGAKKDGKAVKPNIVKGTGYYVMLILFAVLIVVSIYLKRRQKAHPFSKEKPKD
jgi:hypothetical protein